MAQLTFCPIAPRSATQTQRPTGSSLVSTASRATWRSRQTRVVALRLAVGATLADALRATGDAMLVPSGAGGEALATGLAVAVWGRVRPLAHALCEGDRVEVLRGLQLDPMQARRLRYEAAGGVDALRKRGLAGRKR